jgi:hypothetical protein
MPDELELRCRCGVFRGTAKGLSPKSGNRVLCHCNDCQSFAHFLEGADGLLEASAGTDIFQISPARIELTEGAPQLACMRLRPGGLLRWYTACCSTPVGNTLNTGKLPFVGMIVGGVLQKSDAAILGPVRQRVFSEYARGEAISGATKGGASLAVGLRLLRIMLGARLRGDHKRSPFFGAPSYEPSAVPRVLEAEELLRVEAARDAFGQEQKER